MDVDTAVITHYGVGGSLLYLRHLASALEKKSCPVIFYLPKDAEINIKNNSACKYILKDPSTYPVFLKAKLFKYLYHLLKYLYNAIIIRPEKHIKLAHLLFPFYLTDVITISRLKKKGIKIILTVHEVFPHRPFLGGKADMKIIRSMYENSDLLLVHNVSLKNELLDLFSLNPEKIRVVPHGYFEFPQSSVDINALIKKYHAPFDRKILLFFGTVRENKGLDILLNVMREIKEDFFLLIAGQIAGASEPAADYYKGIIKANNVDDSVYWVERYITDEEAAEAFKIAHAVILPYKKNFHAQSGVLNLAIGYEKPCVVSDVGGIGETVKDYGLGIVVEPESPAELKTGILSLFNNHIYGFKRYKQENSWDNVVDKLINEYVRMRAS